MTTFFDKSHIENVLEQLWQQSELDKYCDVVLIAGSDEKQIPAHRCILSAASEYFNKRFTYETKSKEVKINDVNGDTLNLILEYCYTGRVVIKEEFVQDLLETAYMLLLRNAAEASGDFLAKELHLRNCLEFMLLAERYHCQSLSKYAIKYISQHFVDVYETEEFLNLKTEQLGQLLSRDDLRVPNEEHIFESIINWIGHNRIEREKYKDQLFKFIRMPLLKPLILFNRVKPLCTFTECYQLYLEATEWHSSPKRSKLNASELIKSRSYDYLMDITLSEENKKLFLHYFCPQQLKWMKWLNDLEYRHSFAVAILEQQLYIIGGCNKTYDILNTVICVNMKTMTLIHVESMIEHRVACGAAVLNGFLYVGGGFSRHEPFASVERWDPKINAWNMVASMSTIHCYFGFVALNDKLYAIGGRYESHNIRSNECYSPHPNVWTSIAKLQNIYIYKDYVVAANGKLYAANCDSLTVEQYDNITNQWTTICDLQAGYLKPSLRTTFYHIVIVTTIVSMYTILQQMSGKQRMYL